MSDLLAKPVERGAAEASQYGGFGSPTVERGLLRGKSWLLFLSVVVVFAAAIVVRLPYLQSPGMMIDREYRSAIIARAFYFETEGSAPEWRKQLAAISLDREGTMEPPVMEVMVSSIYRVIGGEGLWVARLLSLAFWLIGGALLFVIARGLVGFGAALVAASYYLFVPIGIGVSRSFIPDSLMMMGFLLSLYTILLYNDHPSMGRLLVAGGVSGLTLLTRPIVMFALIAGFAALAIHRKQDRRRVLDSHFWIFAALSMAPAFLFYGYAIFVSGLLSWKAETSFLPHLVLAREFWTGWLVTVTDSGAIGVIALVGGLIGIPMVGKGTPRALLVGLWAGYFVFGLVFTYHIRFAHYYHLQLVPVVAISLGALAALVANDLRRACTGWHLWLPVVGAVALWLITTQLDARSLAFPRSRLGETTAAAIGTMVNHSANVAYLAPDYGMPLKYYGELSGAYWPRAVVSHWALAKPGQKPLTVEERMGALGFSPDYFVITDFPEFETHHADLKLYLEENWRMVAQSNEYLVYEATRPQRMVSPS